MQQILQHHLVVTEVAHHIAETVHLFGGLPAAAGDEPLHLDHRAGQVGQRGVQIRPAAVDHTGQAGQPILELDDLGVAVPQHRHEGLQVLDDLDDVAAAVGEDPAQPGQLPDRLAQFHPVAVECVGGAVDEPPHRRCRHLTGRSEVGGQPVELGFDLIPFHRDRGAVGVDHRAVPHPRCVGTTVHPERRGQLHVAGADQIPGDDHRLRVGGDGHLVVDDEGHPRLGALRFDVFDGADPDPGDPHLVTGVDRGGGGEQRGDPGGLEHGGAQHRDHTGHQQNRQDGGEHSTGPSARAHGCPQRSLGCGTPL